MSHRVNLTKPTPNPELEELLAQARKILMTPEQERAQARSFVIGQMLLSHPWWSRDYVTGIMDALEMETCAIKTNPEPWEVAETIANGIRSNKRGSDVRTRALAWAADVAISLYPAPDCDTSKDAQQLGIDE